MVFRTFTKRQTFSFLFLPKHIDSISSIFFFSSCDTNQRWGCDTKKAISQITLIKRAQKYDTIAKISNVNKVHLGVISKI
jgi:hypothetical protein